MNDYIEHHAVITGAGGGIGAAVVDALAHLNVRLTLIGRRAEPLRRKAQSVPSAIAVSADASDRESVQRAFDQAQQAWGRIDILVNCAGGALSQPFARLTSEDWDAMLRQNATSAFLCAQAFLEQADTSRFGRIVNLASTAGLKGYGYVAAYCAAKHAVVGLTRALAVELARTAVTVNAVCPGYTDTDLIDQAAAAVASKTGRTPADVRAQFASVNPQKRLIEPYEVATTVAWLCSPEAAAVNGQAIAVCGGETIA